MKQTDRPILVIGATGFLGRHVVSALIEKGHRVRCLARSPRRAHDLVGDRTQVVQGDMLDSAAVERASEGVRAIYVCVHTISKQVAQAPDGDFMDVERAGIQNIIAAAKSQGVRRVIYVTSIGVAPDAASAWLRGRWATEQLLLTSGLDATVLRPGMIVGHGGGGFSMVERGARRATVVLLASRAQRFRTIAVDDLAHQLVSLLDEPRSFGQHYDVGSDDVLSIDEMIDIAAEHLGNRAPKKVHLPRRAIARVAPLIERLGGMPRGAIGGFVGPGADADMVGDAAPIRTLLAEPPHSYQDAMIAALSELKTKATFEPRA